MDRAAGARHVERYISERSREGQACAQNRGRGGPF
jgi:hypothetical protein